MPATALPPRAPAQEVLVNHLGDPIANFAALLNRISFGVTRADYDRCQTIGPEAYLDEQLNPQSIDDSALDTILAGAEFNTLAMTPSQLYTQANTSVSVITTQLINATLIRAIRSNRQLYERLVEFWSDHFNINNLDDFVNFLKTWDDRNVIRPNVLGSFRDLLRASAYSPAMLIYLNNNVNVASSPNENYGREILELHSMGVDGGYTQTDVREVARCFTGWTTWTSSAGASAYSFRYNNAVHDQGQKIIFAGTPQQLVIPANGGHQDGELVINALAAHPSTARYIATKLLKRFWGEDPPQELINATATVFTLTQGDLKQVTRFVLMTQLGGPKVLKYKRPFHLMASMLRQLGATVPTNPSSLRSAIANAGHAPFAWIPPDGYPDTLAYWSGLQLARWNMGASLMNNQYTNVTVDAAGLTAGLTTAPTIANQIARLLCPQGIAQSDRTALINYLGTGVPTLTRIRETFGIAIASPSFQWY